MTADPSASALNTKNAETVSAPNASSSSTTATALYQNRTVARPVANLGNTCYMNAVLQALAHAPELCLAIDCEPHTVSCPIAAWNASKQLDRPNQMNTQQQMRSSPSSSPDGGINFGIGTRVSGNGTSGNVAATRKSRRTGRKSPRNTDISDGTSNTSNDSYGQNGIRFCALCEVERHMHEVHDPTSRDKAVIPESFVHGIFDTVAPWFKLGIQEDSHEFLRLLIDAMQKSCRRTQLSDVQHQNKNQNLDLPTVAADETKGETFEAVENADVPTKAEESTEVKADIGSTQTITLSPIVKSPRSQNYDKEYPFSLFRGSVESRVVCGHCQATSSTLDPIEDVGLEVAACADINTQNPGSNSLGGSGSQATSPVSTPLLDVQAAFQRYASTEALDSGYKCEKCGKVGRATKQSRLASIPPILTLHLKRFRYGGNDPRTSGSTGALVNTSGAGNAAHPPISTVPTRSTRSTRSSEVSQLLGTTDYYTAGKSGSAKIEGHIKFDPVFDLRPYLTKELQDQHTNMFCRLFAVIVHAGKNSHSGHYVAYVRNVTMNEWYKMDDSRVSPATLQEVLNAEAYMLFYRVVQHPISIMLEELYNKKRMEQENNKHVDKVLASDQPLTDATVDVCVHDPNAKVSNPPSQVKESLKRSNTLDRDDWNNYSREGEEWLRTKTNVPPHLHGIVRKAQQVIADIIEVTPTGRQKIAAFAQSTLKDLTEKGSGQLSPCSIITDNDIVGGTDPIRRRLIKLFYLLLQRHKQSNGNQDENDTSDVERYSDWFSPEAVGQHPIKHNGSSESHIPSLLSNDDNELQPTETRTSNDLMTEYDGTGFITASSKMIIEEPEDSIGLL